LAFIALLPGPASADFGGELNRDVVWTLDITPEANGDAIAVTIFQFTESSLQIMDMFTMPKGSQGMVTTFGPLRKKIRRISINAAAVPTTGYQIRIVSGAIVLTFDAVGDKVIVFDVP
jgi:hypothetical protein